MKTKSIYGLIGAIILVILSITSYSIGNVSLVANRDRIFNAEWRFVRDSLTGAEQSGYDDSKWMVVDLPHDYSIMDLPGEDGSDQVGPFSKKSPNGRSNGYVLGGTAWYRKHFTMGNKDLGKRIILNFDGVYMETEVWVNGKKAGINKYGYSPFWFDITNLLNSVGKPNVIAVKVDNTGRNTRWYSGSGIFRNVKLIATDPLHVDVWGVRITTPLVSKSSANVNITVTIKNDNAKISNAIVSVRILDKDENIVAEGETTSKVDASSSSNANLSITIRNPELWSPETPSLYEAEVTIKESKKIRDVYTQPFGIRSLEFSVKKGFLLNGVSIKLKGACVHHDNGLLGSAAIDRAEERRVELLKANGFNAIRCSHNPPSETFLNICDKLGMLVMDEFVDMWETPKNPEDYSRFFKEWWKKDMEAMFLRDKNHPSIILWSIGNEVPEKNDTSGLRIGKQLAEHMRSLDNTRPVTEAIDKRQVAWDVTAAAFSFLDVAGYNYQNVQYESDHEKYPNRIIVGTESYPYQYFDYWQGVVKNPYVIGDFVWTGMDYLGEVALGRSRYVPASQSNEGFGMFPGPQSSTPPSGTTNNIGATTAPGGQTPAGFAAAMQRMPSSWPWYVAWCGDIDLLGEKKPQMLYKDVIWDNSKLEINVHEPIPAGMVERVGLWAWPQELPSWNWKGNEGVPLQVRVFTQADRVKLELNGKLIGEKNLTIGDKYIAIFDVPYQPGELKATAYLNGKEIAVKSLKTTGEPVSLRIVADRNTIRADRNDLSYLTIEAIDANGQVVNNAVVKVILTLSGDGELVGSGNASPDDMNSFGKQVINTYKGKALAIVRPFAKSGEIIFTAKGENLVSRELKITVK